MTNLHQRLQLLRNLVADLQRNQAKILTEIAIDTGKNGFTKHFHIFEVLSANELKTYQEKSV